MKKITIIYGSDTGNTKSVAEKIAAQLAHKNPQVLDVAKATTDDVEKADVLILGTPTWGYGDMQDDWDSFLPGLEGCGLAGKTVALFGLGDSDAYPDTFVDAMGTLYKTLKKSSCNIVGRVSSSGYTFEDSTAVENGNFVGLALNEDGEPDLTDQRISAWITSIAQFL